MFLCRIWIIDVSQQYCENFRKIEQAKLVENLSQRGGSNEYQQSMFLRRNKKNNVYPCKPQFYCIKVGFKGVTII